jgi:ABC-type antimicrobial peptide transport system permease subunit
MLLEMSRTSILMIVGLTLGLAVSIVVTRALTGLLFGVKPWDASVFATAAVVLAGSALFASWLPARRAARIDPATALRSE